jgi:hypothetical protein
MIGTSVGGPMMGIAARILAGPVSEAKGIYQSAKAARPVRRLPYDPATRGGVSGGAAGFVDANR